MSAKFTGGCACGAVRYEIDGEPLKSVQCQCRDCQRATGTGHADALAFPRSAIALSGTLKFHELRADSGNSMSRGFCPECGAPVLWKFGRNPELQAIMAGSLDDPGLFAPQVVLYASRGHAWDRLDPALPKFDALPPR